MGSVTGLLTWLLLGVRDLLIWVFGGRVCLGLIFLLLTRLGLILLVLIFLGQGASCEEQEEKDQRNNPRGKTVPVSNSAT